MSSSKTLNLAAVIACGAALSVSACGKKDAPAPAAEQPTAKTAEAPAADKAAEKPAEPAAPTLDRAKLSAFAALPGEVTAASGPASDAMVALGKMLYFEKRLSKNQDVSCNSCHMLDKGGVDGSATSSGHKAQKGGRNAPTVFNAALHTAQFWDGRAKDVEEQAKGPILNPIEMAMPNAEAVIAVLKSMPEYVAAFQAAFPGQADAVTYDNVGIAIGAFERKLTTPGRFDAFLKGDDKALSDDEKAGLATFLDTGCASCHTGAAVGGGMFQKLGLVKPWPDLKDNGRFDATKDEADKFKFKVPSLRQIADTAPYFHDGSVRTLEEAVKLMAAHQLGKDLDEAKIKAIVTFLKALSGEANKELTAEPKLPASSETTPKADPS